MTVTSHSGDRFALAAEGAWTLAHATALEAECRAIAHQMQTAGARHAAIDASGIQALDSAGALLLLALEIQPTGARLEVTFKGLAPAQAHLVSRIRSWPDHGAAKPPPARPRRGLGVLLEGAGGAAIVTVREAGEFLNFLGTVSLTLLRSAGQPGRLGLRAFASHLQRAGFDALPIVGALAFLIGVVLAYQGADQLRQFGAQIYTVDLLGISVLREMGVLLTAIIAAGRSGSAFAAQIGTMQANQEVDAIRTIGLDPVAILVIPRLLALAVALPLLTVFADLMGLFGGALMLSTSLDISFVQYLNRMQDAVPVSFFWVGLGKAPVFGALIALVGCLEGFRVSGSAESVGIHTTRAVVFAIFLVIVADAGFSILFSLAGL